MKKISDIIIILLLFCSSLQAQELSDILNAAKDAFGEAKDAGKEQADTDAEWGNTMKEINKKIEDRKFKNLMGNFSEALNKFSNESKTGKCLQIMGAYAEMLAYCDLKAETETDPCKKKDWLGIESMVLFAGTAINYCPQEFYGLSADGDKDDGVSKQYEIKIRNYFFGNQTLYDDSIVLGENQIELFELGNRAKNMYNDALAKFLKDKGKRSYSDLDPKDKETFNLWLKKLQFDFSETVKHELPHMVLYYKFKFANEQLELNNLANSEAGQPIVNFVGKMFTPEFLVKKTLEIANENGKLKCIPK